MDLNIRLLCVGAFLLVEYFGLASGVTHECVPGRYQNPIVWVRPGHPVVLTSPPNFRVLAADVLICKWEVRPEWGTKLVMKVNEKDIDYDCNANKLSIKSEKGTFDFESECGNDTLPSLAESVMDEGPIIVDFQSSNNDEGKVEFSLTFESYNPPEKNDEYASTASYCREGACCEGEDCCVLGVNPAKPIIVGESIQDVETENIKKINEELTNWKNAKGSSYNWNTLLEDYYMAPGNTDSMDCTVKLVAQPGFQISINFKKMDMLEGTAGGCDEDYVHIYENVDTTTFGVFGKTGLKFCGQHLPNSPAPSIFVSSKNELYVKYRTDEKKKKRGMGFEMKVTAVNPLVTPMIFSHKYGETTCWDQCKPPPFPTTLPPPTPTPTIPPPCKPLFDKIFISNATNPHPEVPGATVNFVLKSDSSAAEFSDLSDTNGLVRFSEDPTVQPHLESGKTYSVDIEKEGFLYKTVNIHLHCEPQKDDELCPHCYFTELVPQPTPTPKITSPKAESSTSGTGTPPTGKPQKTTPGAPGEKSTKKGKTTEAAQTKSTEKTGESTKKPTERPGEKTPVSGTSEATKPQEASTKGIATTPQAVYPPTTTSIYRKEKYPKCGDKDFVTPQNQAICDCTEDRCDQEKKRETGKCEPCIDIPLVELITTTPAPTTSTTPCEGDNCTTPQSTAPQPTTTPCPAEMNNNNKTIKVTVFDKVPQTPIDQVNVTLKQIHPNYGFVANYFTRSDGVATIKINEDGNFTVILEKPGYEHSEKNVTIKCNVEDGCICSVDITANLTKTDPCTEGSSIEVKVRKYVGTPKSQGGGNTEDVTNFGTGKKDTKITLNGKYKKNVTGVFNETSNYVVFDVTGGVPDDYTIEVKDVGVDTGKIYDPSSEVIEFKMCEYSSTMPEDCCKKQHEIVVDFEPPTTKTITTPTTPMTTAPCKGPDCTTVTTTPATTTTPCPYQTEDTLHVWFCGDTSYTKFGEPTVTFTDRGKITGQTKLGSITKGDLKSTHCTGSYADKKLINEYEPDLIKTRITRDTMKIEVKGENFETTSDEITMDCTTVQGCNNCTARLQVLVKPKVCDKEYFTLTVIDNNGERVEGATVIGKKTDETEIINKKTDEQGYLKINFDRTMEKIKLTISKTGFKTVDTEGLLNCKLKPCGECNPKLEKEIKQGECPDPPNYPETPEIVVNVKEDDSGNSVKEAKVVVTRKSDNKVITKDDDYTNDEGESRIIVESNGDFRVDITHGSHLSKTVDVTVKECNSTSVTVKVHPHSTTSPLSTPISTEPCVYKPEDVKIHFKVLDISVTKKGKPLDLSDAKITVHYIEGTGQQKNEVLITEREKTDKLGELKIPAATNGNYSYSVSKEGFIEDPTVGWIMVDCDCVNQTACKPVVTIEMRQKPCDIENNFYVNVTSCNDHSLIENALVTLTLKKYRNTEISNKVGEKRTAENGIVSFKTDVSGEYWIDVKLTDYIDYSEKINFTCDVNQCQTCNHTHLVCFRKEGCPKPFTVVVRTSTNNKIIEGATVSATRAGFSNGVVKHVITTTTNASGIATIPLNDNGEYTFEVEAKDYIKFTGKQIVNLTANSPECDAKFYWKDVPLHKNICDSGVRLSLTWGKGDPIDLDLYSFRVLNSDSSKYCQTYWCDRKEQCGCTYFDTDNLYAGDHGAETITLCCADIYSYMLYVDDRTGYGKYLPGSDASIDLQSNVKYANLTLEKPSDASTKNKRYWIAGCLTTGSGNFHYIPVNQFTETQPSSGEPLLCHNLMETYKEEEKRAQFPNNVKLSVTALDMKTHNKAADARIKVTPVRNRKIVAQESSTPSNTSRSDAAVSFSIGENGEYKITAEKEGYTATPIFVEFMCDKTNCNVPALTTYFLKKLDVGDIRISLTYQKKTDFHLDLVQVNKDDPKEVCVALKKYNPATKNVDCPTVDLEWTSSPSFKGNGDGNGDSFVLRKASSNTKYTYLIYIDMDKDIPDEYTYLTLSDSNQDRSIKVLPPKNFVKDDFYYAGCLEIKGTSYNFVEFKSKDNTTRFPYEIKDPASDGRLMCHDLLKKNKGQPAVWTVRDTFCKKTNLTVIAKDTNGKEISESKTTTTLVDNLKLDPRLHRIYPSGPINQLKATELIGNGVYTTKVEADGYVTDSVERTVTCDIEKCSECTPKTVIVMANKTEVESGAIILSVTSQTGAVLKFVVYDGKDVNMETNDEGNVISIPYGTKEATITLAVAQAITETGKLSDTDAVFTLRYGDSLIKLKIPTDRYNGEKHWLIGSLKIKENKEVEFFSDNFYANALEVFDAIKDRRKIGLTLPAAPAPPPVAVAAVSNNYGIPRCPKTVIGNMDTTRDEGFEIDSSTQDDCVDACKAKYPETIGVSYGDMGSGFWCSCELGDINGPPNNNGPIFEGFSTCLL